MAILVLYGSNVADATLTTACDMAVTSGGVEGSAVSTFSGGAGNDAEVWSQTNSTSPVVSGISAAPSGHGWVYRPGAGTFSAANWSASIALSSAAAPNAVTTVRFFRLPGGVLGSAVSIGTIATGSVNVGATRTVLTFAATAMPATAFAATDVLYIDLWFNDVTGVFGDNPSVYESTSSSAGVSNDMQVTTANFTASSSVFIKRLYMPDGTPRALGGTIIPQVIKPPVIYTPHALGATLLTDSRTFIPRALGGVYIQDDPTKIWLPRALGGTTQVASSVALACTIQGTGLEVGTLSLATSLADTIPGIGALTATLAAKLPFTSTLRAIGTITSGYRYGVAVYGTAIYNGAFTLKTALVRTIAGVGTLVPTLSASLALPSMTIPGVGTLTGTFTESTALTTTIPAVGTITGSLSTSTNVNLSVTLPAVGTVTMAGAALSTSLTDTINAVGSLTAVLSASIALASISIPAIGTLTGTLGASAPLSSTVAGVGTINATLGESTSLTVSLSVIGTLTGTMTVGNSVSLAVTIPGVGTLTAAAPGFKTALVASIAALGVMSPGAAFSEVLAGTTLAGVGTLSETISLAVILGTTLAGVGVLSVTYQVHASLSVQFMALGTLLGTIRVPATFFGPYGATEVVSSKLTSSHTVTSKSSQHIASSYTATRK